MKGKHKFLEITDLFSPFLGCMSLGFNEVSTFLCLRSKNKISVFIIFAAR